ncbi:ATP-binding protein [Treponema parvum]|uniref:ATP-binding protein n=1 Tax=Treponema parvum TaxID=138851 RepID=A0A975EY38_9SPIR|nr:ATP-binding protein [Treponema parvum]QTQ10973.1 ATP-binding protein [Treponema parvum]
MLLEFAVENYKSFKDRVKFSMVPAPKQKGLDYSILHKKIGKKEYKALSSAVVYGPNAAGKTNIIGALQTFKTIVQRGNIRNVAAANSPNATDYALELIPNNTLKEKKNVFFSIKFIHDELVIKYSILLDLGKFLEKDYDRNVVEENLEINGKIFFNRIDNELKFENLSFFDKYKYYILTFTKNFKTLLPILKTSLKKDDLFLMNGFRTIVSSVLAELISDYFTNYLKTVYRADAVYTAPIFDSNSIVDGYLNEAATKFGINSNKLVFVKNKKEDNLPILYSVMSDKKAIPSEAFESYGTIRFVNIFPFVAETLRKGLTLVVDEFDSSIHPSAIMDIITIFHNDEVNINHAQLIFNTHNPLYLNNNLFRRDEIKFIDRDDESKCSRYYSLSDFGTTGTTARKGKDYMNNYFMDEYGAIRDIDFTDLFMKIIKEKQCEKEEI